MSEKQKRLSISQKCSIVAELEKGTSQAEASRNFGVSKPAIKYIWDNREKFKGAVDSGLPNKRSNMKGPEKCKGLDSPLLEWFSNLRAAGKEVTGNMLLINAKNMATRLGFGTDTVNESWLQRWRERHGIHFKTIYGEANDCPDFEKWLEVMLPTFDEYEPSHILNADETALFYRMTGDILAMEDVEYKEAVAAQPVVDFEEFMREIEGVCSEEEDIKGESESETEDNEPLPSTSECVAMLKQLKRRFIFSTGYVPNSVIETEEALLKLPLKQANITDFFKQP